MKAIIAQGWDDAVYKEGRIRFFPCWSNLVEGEGDKTLTSCRSSMLGVFNWLRKYFFWKKYIILVPKSDRGDVIFRVGFYSKHHNVCKISTIVRNVSNGPFAMRMGPENCHFFVVGTADITLEIAGYVRKDIDLH